MKNVQCLSTKLRREEDKAEHPWDLQVQGNVSLSNN